MEIEGKIWNRVYQEYGRLVLLKIEGSWDLGYSGVSNSYQKQKKGGAALYFQRVSIKFVEKTDLGFWMFP